MPRRARPVAVIPTTSMVASAVRYPGEVARIYEGVKEWQREAYRHYRICGEARYAADFYGSALSRSTLHIAQRNERGEKVIQVGGEANAILDDLFAGKDGQAQMLKAMGVHLTIAGECYLVGRTVTPEEAANDVTMKSGGDIWEIVSVEEMIVAGRTWSIRVGANRKPVELTRTDVVIRVWFPDPADRMQADSPFRSLLPVLKEIEWLTLHIFAQLTSRLAGAGLLFLSQDITFPPPLDEDGKAIATKNEADAVMTVLADAMMRPLRDPSNPASKVPVVLQVPTELLRTGKAAELLQFWTQLDSESREMRSDSIRRFAIGMNLPVEVILGMSSNPGTGGGASSGVSHWGAWQIEEQTIKMHLEPTLDLVVNSLTVGYLRPLMTDETATDEIAYSTEALRLRPDRSKESMELYNMGQLKADVMVTENGFSTSDMPDDTEFRKWLLTKVASGSATPEQVQAALALLGRAAAGFRLETPAPPRVSPGPTRHSRTTRPGPAHRRPPRCCWPPPTGWSTGRWNAPATGSGATPRSGRPTSRPSRCTPRSGSTATPTSTSPTHGRAPRRSSTGSRTCRPTVKSLDAYCRTLFFEKAEHTRTRLAEWLEVAR